VTLLDGTKMSHQDILLKFVHFKPSIDDGYYRFSKIVPLGSSITLLNGTEMTKQDLLLKVVDLNPSHSEAFEQLGDITLLGGSIVLLNGTKMTKEELHLKAAELQALPHPESSSSTEQKKKKKKKKKKSKKKAKPDEITVLTDGDYPSSHLTRRLPRFLNWSYQEKVKKIMLKLICLHPRRRTLSSRASRYRWQELKHQWRDP
jgi:hypothetical protein